MNLRKVITELLSVMEAQEKRETGEFHISAHSFRPIWNAAKASAKRALRPKRAATKPTAK